MLEINLYLQIADNLSEMRGFRWFSGQLIRTVFTGFEVLVRWFCGKLIRKLVVTSREVTSFEWHHVITIYGSKFQHTRKPGFQSIGLTDNLSRVDYFDFEFPVRSSFGQLIRNEYFGTKS